MRDVDLAIVTLTFKLSEKLKFNIMSGHCLGNFKVYEIDTWLEYW